MASVAEGQEFEAVFEKRIGNPEPDPPYFLPQELYSPKHPLRGSSDRKFGQRRQEFGQGSVPAVADLPVLKLPVQSKDQVPGTAEVHIATEAKESVQGAIGLRGVAEQPHLGVEEAAIGSLDLHHHLLEVAV